MTDTKMQPQVTSTHAGDGGEAVAESKETVAGSPVATTGSMHWYVACVRVNCEKKTKAAIERDFEEKQYRLETWLATERRIVINSRGKRIMREAVVLTTFVFVKVEDKHLNDIRFRSYVYKMLSKPGKNVPCIIPEAEFENFRRLVDSGKAEIQNHPLGKGDRVRIIDGELTGVVAYVQRIQGKKAFIGNEIRNICGATIEIEKDKLEFFKDDSSKAKR